MKFILQITMVILFFINNGVIHFLQIYYSKHNLEISIFVFLPIQFLFRTCSKRKYGNKYG